MPPRVEVDPTQTTSPCSPGPQVREGGPVDALCAEHVRVVDGGQFLGSEGLGGAGDQVAGVVHQHIERSGVGEDGGDGRVGRLLGEDVEFDGAQIHGVFCGVRLRLGDTAGVAALGVAHGGVDGVAGARERPGGEGTETGSGTGDDDGLAHD